MKPASDHAFASALLVSMNAPQGAIVTYQAEAERDRAERFPTLRALVVAFIALAVLAALAVPFVRAVRADVRPAVCANIHNYAECNAAVIESMN